MTTASVHRSLAALLLVGLAVGVPRPAPAGGRGASDASVRVLATRDLVGDAGKELRLLSVDYRPGGTSLPHRHNAQVFVYVLEGTLRMQIEGAAPVTLRRGQVFYEGPDDVHAISANVSRSARARLLVFMVKDKQAPASVPVTGGGAPSGAALPR